MRVSFEKPEEPFHPVTITLESRDEVVALLLRLHVPRSILKDYYYRADFGPVMSWYPNAWEDEDPCAAEMFQDLVRCLRNHPQASRIVVEEPKR